MNASTTLCQSLYAHDNMNTNNKKLRLNIPSPSHHQQQSSRRATWISKWEQMCIRNGAPNAPSVNSTGAYHCYDKSDKRSAATMYEYNNGNSHAPYSMKTCKYYDNSTTYNNTSMNISVPYFYHHHHQSMMMANNNKYNIQPSQQSFYQLTTHSMQNSSYNFYADGRQAHCNNI